MGTPVFRHTWQKQCVELIRCTSYLSILTLHSTCLVCFEAKLNQFTRQSSVKALIDDGTLICLSTIS